MGKCTEDTKVVVEQPADKKGEKASCGCGCTSGTKSK